MTRKIQLRRTWQVGERIGQGGFAQVFAARSDGDEAAVKIVPKEPGADRELLLADVGDARNVVPVLDFGEEDDSWVIVMPRASMSLRDRLNQVPGALSLEETIAVLADMTEALSDLADRIVHRDLKPENVLRLGDRWCLTDFGISRYAESATDANTRKYAHTSPYTAPERWRLERATPASDMYSLGVMAYEMVAGVRPFRGPNDEDFRDQHLHSDPPTPDGIPPLLASAITECLFKAPSVRPTAANLRARLDTMTSAAAAAPGLARLQQASRGEADRRSELQRQQSAARSVAERRADIGRAADTLYGQISAALLAAVTQAAPMAELESRGGDSWVLKLGRGALHMTPSSSVDRPSGEYAFDVARAAEITLTVPRSSSGYRGRSHSLWFGDVQAEGDFSWFETAFMVSPLLQQSTEYAPYSARPESGDAKQALLPGMGKAQSAWPFTRLAPGGLEEFIERWGGWFADAAEGRLAHPSSMPERPPAGTWRST